MNEYLQKMLHTVGPVYKFESTPAPLSHNAHGLTKSIDFETGLLLKNFVVWKKPQVIVELGSFRGYSTAWLRLGTILNQLGHVHAFEVFKEGHYGPMWYDELGMPREHFTYHEIPGGIWRYPDQIPETIDLVFHDTQHLPGPTYKELTLLLPRVPVGGMVLIDDMSYRGYEPMQEVVSDFFKNRDYWDFEVLRLGHGLGIAERLK